MKRALSILTIVLGLALLCGGLAAQDKKDTKSIPTTSAPNTAKPTYPFDKVPQGMTYRIFDQGGKEIKQFKSGEATGMTLDCVQIECPSRFKNAACWKCKKRKIKATK